ncbi:OPT superfamily oligopeptide transporter [Aspergillus pseudoustus]|uniref:OPT superfamily oligopeptide transporter n=1 Tax=Aspergillus pseudoustus TaxID=1810923 RepID=A0ABR4KEF0_9EURO
MNTKKESVDISTAGPEAQQAQADEKAEGSTELLTTSLYDPFPAIPGEPEEPNPLTVRAVLLGWSLGGLVNASNVYLGLKMGVANDANMLVAIVGYSLMQFCHWTSIPFLRGTFGPKEHALIQTVATSCGGLSTLFIAAVPAMYQLNLMGDNPTHDYWRLVTLTAASAFFGTAISAFMRKRFVIGLARELQLSYPTAVAVATTIRNFHQRTTGDRLFRKQTRVLLLVFAFCLVWVVGTSYATGILFDWYVFWWFYAWGGYNNAAVQAVNWGFQTIEWTPAFLGFGMLFHMNVAVSWMAGYIVAFGIVGPILVAKGMASGIAYSAEYPDLVTFMSLDSADPLNSPSPRYWLMWPAILVMITASVTDLACQWRVFGRSVRIAARAAAASIGRWRRPQEGRRPSIANAPSGEQDVRWWENWGSLFLSSILTCVALGLQYHINVGITILALIMAVLFAIVAVQCTGQTSTSPIVIVANIMQLLIGAIYRNSSHPVKSSMLANLVTAAVGSTAAMQACEMTTDFKIGFFLRTPPRLQWYGQWLGTIPAIFLSPAMFIVFMKGYGCVLDLSQATTCSFSAPSAAAYRVVTSSILSPELPISGAIWGFAGVACALTIMIHCLRAWAQATDRFRLAACLPNMMAMGFGVVLPASQYGLALVIGALAARLWRRKHPHTFNLLYFAVAAGMIGGESIGGLVKAILNIANVGGPTYYGTTLGCPAGAC